MISTLVDQEINFLIRGWGYNAIYSEDILILFRTVIIEK